MFNSLERVPYELSIDNGYQLSENKHDSFIMKKTDIQVV